MNKYKDKAVVKAYKRNAIVISTLLILVIIAVIAILYMSVFHEGRISLWLIYATIGFALIILFYLMHFLKSEYTTLLSLIEKIYSGMDEIGISNNNDTVSPISEVNDVFIKLKSLIELIENLNKNIPFKDQLKQIYNSFSDYIPYSHIGVALIDDDGDTIRASYAADGENKNKLTEKIIGYKTSISSTSLKKVVDSGEVRVINDLGEYVEGKPLKPYNKILLESGIRSSITYPLKNDNKTIGIIFFSSDKVNAYNDDHIKFLKTLATSITLSIEKDIMIKNMVLSSALALATLTEERDPETGMHLERMQKYSKVLAELLAKTEKYKDIIDIDYINDIVTFSQLHDIGKVAIKDDILLKPGKLTKEEFAIMKTHTIYGGKVLRLAEENVEKRGRKIFRMGIEIAEGHHEKWNGTGYPYGKKGEDIPLCARIVAVADVLDALTSKRPYKEPFSFEESVDIIKKDSGKQFDPFIVGIFEKYMDLFVKIYNGL